MAVKGETIYDIDYNPHWGTRYQEHERETIGPFALKLAAEQRRDDILKEKGWNRGDNRVTIVKRVLL